MRYHRGASGQDSYLLFSTPRGDARFYSVTRLLMLVGQGYARANQVETWKELTEARAIEPLRLTIESKQREVDGSIYLLVTDVQKTDQLDAILEGEHE